MAGFPEPGKQDRQQWLGLILLVLLSQVVIYAGVPTVQSPMEAVPPGRVDVQLFSLGSSGLWGEVVAEHGKMDASMVIVNDTDEADLTVCPGIGPELARSIIAARTQSRFFSWDDLRKRVKGIGPATVMRLQNEGVRLNRWDQPVKAMPMATPDMD